MGSNHTLRSGPLIAKALPPVLRFGPRFGPQTHSGALAAFRGSPVGGDIARKASGRQRGFLADGCGSDSSPTPRVPILLFCYSLTERHA